MSNPKNTILHASNIKKSFHDGTNIVHVLKNIDLSVQTGDQIAIIGPSGSGKSTLLQILSGLEKPSTGKMLIQGEDIWTCSEKKRCSIRNAQLGFIYQFHHLLPEFSALENVAMPLHLAKNTLGISSLEARERAEIILEKVGLAHRLQHKPSQLSGGERQRVAIARALVVEPSCILADEPTGNLDQKTAESVYSLLVELNQEVKTSLIMVTHDERLAARMDKIYCLLEGQLVPHE